MEQTDRMMMETAKNRFMKPPKLSPYPGDQGAQQRAEDHREIRTARNGAGPRTTADEPIHQIPGCRADYDSQADEQFASFLHVNYTKAASNFLAMAFLATAPMSWSTGLPFLNKITVGMLMTPNSPAV